MQLDYSVAEQAFRQEVRQFLRAKLPDDIRRKVFDYVPLQRAEVMQWHRLLYEQGWVAPSWSKEDGGAEWTPVQRHIFDDEAEIAGAPLLVPFGLNMCGPVIIQYGTVGQKNFFLPRILSGEHIWCQGFSEPDAGSDLASLNTRAIRSGDSYIVDGQKIWTTMAHWANWIFCLVRTDPGAARKQSGISFLLIDLNSPGVSVRQIRTLDGEAEFNEVFFDAVRVPLGNLVGTENDGWSCAKYLLVHERTGEARLGIAKRQIERLKMVLATNSFGDARLNDQRWRDRVAAVEIELMALEVTKLRVDAWSGDARSRDATASLLKIKSTELLQRLSSLLMDAAAVSGIGNQMPGGDQNSGLRSDQLARAYFDSRKLTIYGGSNEIQRNIIARATLGL